VFCQSWSISKKRLETVELGSHFFFVKPQFACQSLWGPRPPIRMSAQVLIDGNVANIVADLISTPSAAKLPRYYGTSARADSAEVEAPLPSGER
jgi:hypothetical protein